MTLMTLATIVNDNARPLANAPVFDVPVLAVRDEDARDIAAREALLDESFGLARRRKTCERLREGRAPARGLALAACEDARLVGTIRLWDVDAGGVPALLLGPMAVAAGYRGRGVGGRLMGEALFRAASLGHTAVLLVGDAPYYERFGFSRASTRRLTMPGPVEIERFLGLEFEPGALDAASGMVVATGEPAIAARRGRAA